MTLDLSNPGKLALKDLPDDVAVGMFLARRADAEKDGDYMVRPDLCPALQAALKELGE